MSIPIKIIVKDTHCNCKLDNISVDFTATTELQDLRKEIWEAIKFDKFEKFYYTLFYVDFSTTYEGKEIEIHEELKATSLDQIKWFYNAATENFSVEEAIDECRSEQKLFKNIRFVITATFLNERNMRFWPSFPSPFNNFGYGSINEFAPKTLRELEMMSLSAEIRRKKLWFEKMVNPQICTKWKSEALEQDLTENQFNYVLQELVYYAKLRDSITDIQVSDIDGLWHSDSLIEPALRSKLVQCIAELENIPESSRDWHPGSRHQVWDLVHPSIYPLMYGKTRVTSKPFETAHSLKYVGGGEILNFEEIKPESGTDHSTSALYSWLPTEFNVDVIGKVQISSYINNLHPTANEEFYCILEQIFAKFLPLFENVLNDLIFTIKKEPRIQNSGSGYPDPVPSFPGYDEYLEWRQNCPISIPDAPENFIEPEPAPVDKKICLKGTNLQVIVKLANIMLTPQNPKFPGGVWHVEGMKNENIVATGIYYYDVQNITESELAFRQFVDPPHYDHEDERGVQAIYGLQEGGPMNQMLGKVLTTENRCLAFPNVFQHCVQPFELRNPTKAGHRKILVFFLVDPGKRIVSTSTVPPQERDWFVEELLKIPPFNLLPWEITEHILTFLDWPMTLAEAQSVREELMKERKYFISKDNEENFERPFSFCEH